MNERQFENIMDNIPIFIGHYVNHCNWKLELNPLGYPLP